MAGLSGKTIGQVMNGQFTLAGIGSNSTSASGSNTGTNSTSSGSSGSTSSVTGSVTHAMLTAIGGARGWTGQQIDDWMQVISMESGGDPNAINSSTGAFGIGQMLANGGSPSNLAPNKAKYSSYGGSADSVTGQLTGMAGYISQTYGNPSNALAHEHEYGWY